MAKFIFGKKLNKNDNAETEVTTKNTSPKTSKEKRAEAFEKLVAIAATGVEAIDETTDEVGDICKAGADFTFDLGAMIINFCDKIADLIYWFALKMSVIMGRKWVNFLLSINHHKEILIKDGLAIVAACLCLAGIFAWGTNYEYSYNGRVLGYVEDQGDVVEILDIISEELSAQYNTNIVIDPTTDIEFRPVVAFGKEMDDSDTVLRRFTYLTEINAQGYAIKADGEVIAVVETEEIANKVLDSIKALYVVNSESVKYEYIGFAEEIVIEPYGTTLNNISSLSGAVKKIKDGGQQASVYTVVNGDTLYGICKKLGISMNQLKAMNPGLSVNTVLHAGDKFNTTEAVPLITVETIEVSTFAENIPYKTEYNSSSKYYKGEQVVTKNGKNGKAKVTARLVKKNGKTIEREDLSRETIIEPVTRIITKGTAATPPKKGTGQFKRPTTLGVSYAYGWRWGRMHYGIDFAGPVGTKIVAADGGTVTMSQWYGNYGYCIQINHGNGFTTLYAHCSKLYVSVGAKVYKGQTIAAVGNTGRSTGPHLHFEIKKNGKNVNPAHYL